MPGWTSQLSQWWWKDEMLNLGISKLSSSINKTLDSEDGIWILRNDHQNAESELSVLLADNGDFKESIDLSGWGRSVDC